MPENATRRRQPEGDIAHQRAVLANAIKYEHDPEAIAAARRDLAAATLAGWIERKLDAAPPLTGEQLARLRALLTPAGNGNAR